eukprot:CAMPEP_0114508744 /NCGR_PEP_ID=MMETSP0109-20121206/12799_1 /TAXON_ID=29199 /ORGANISM="Chlorarachnion reptans, Strain CCCM449" /LENGTH=185 /DNA_ID=CAMNT_0001687769 /DNA_START=426 /DNA_END=980 /DNA_ORIENTATION=+
MAGVASAVSTCLALKTHSYFVRVTLQSRRTEKPVSVKLTPPSNIPTINPTTDAKTGHVTFPSSKRRGKLAKLAETAHRAEAETEDSGKRKPATCSEPLHFFRFMFVPELVYNRAAMMGYHEGFPGNYLTGFNGGSTGQTTWKKRGGIRVQVIISNWLQGVACLGWISVVVCQKILPALTRANSLW